MFNFLNPERILLTIPGIIIGLAFHEFAHALASDRLGDPTPRNMGRLTISPIPHIDPIGLLLIIFAGFGWAKPVQINPRYYKNPKRDDMIVSFAGPFTNLLIAFLFAFVFSLLVKFSPPSLLSNKTFGILARIFDYTIWINVILFLFNLIPLPPLDGFHILADIIPFKHSNVIFTLRKYSTIILIIIIVTPIVSIVIGTPANFIYNLIYGIFGI